MFSTIVLIGLGLIVLLFVVWLVSVLIASAGTSSSTAGQDIHRIGTQARRDMDQASDAYIRQVSKRRR